MPTCAVTKPRLWDVVSGFRRSSDFHVVRAAAPWPRPMHIVAAWRRLPVPTDSWFEAFLDELQRQIEMHGKAGGTDPCRWRLNCLVWLPVLVLVIGSSSIEAAPNLPPGVRVVAKVRPESVARGTVFEMTVTIEAPSDWVIYDLSQPAGSAMPAQVHFATSDAYSPVDAFSGPPALERLDPTYLGRLTRFHRGTVTFRRRLLMNESAIDGPVHVSGTVDFQTRCESRGRNYHIRGLPFDAMATVHDSPLIHESMRIPSPIAAKNDLAPKPNRLDYERTGVVWRSARKPDGAPKQLSAWEKPEAELPVETVHRRIASAGDHVSHDQQQTTPRTDEKCNPTRSAGIAPNAAPTGCVPNIQPDKIETVCTQPFTMPRDSESTNFETGNAATTIQIDERSMAHAIHALNAGIAEPRGSCIWAIVFGLAAGFAAGWPLIGATCPTEKRRSARCLVFGTFACVVAAGGLWLVDAEVACLFLSGATLMAAIGLMLPSLHDRTCKPTPTPDTASGILPHNDRTELAIAGAIGSPAIGFSVCAPFGAEIALLAFAAAWAICCILHLVGGHQLDEFRSQPIEIAGPMRCRWLAALALSSTFVFVLFRWDASDGFSDWLAMPAVLQIESAFAVVAAIVCVWPAQFCRPSASRRNRPMMALTMSILAACLIFESVADLSTGDWFDALTAVQTNGEDGDSEL